MTRVDFEERMNVLREQLRLGKMHFAHGLRGPDSLLQVRKLPNGRIDLLSVDETARLQANTMHQMMTGGFGAKFDELVGADDPAAD
ncbi:MULTISPECIES: AVAST type 1 anti-phage system protein Avs1c [unclassified Pseudoxanthomonas]|uniref:AVAST type 1 anti-phage system protein Avs1c n=1 Tax=unclassified Pseudoxanthomonas TaxID=2645906 RepID=UPI001620ECC9|nr:MULTISPECIES: AVAST type 1 anti-phage system protein Avs1c [unclassified Pseudoxanthomonas]MBB3274280.1 hypothetical protein [Pseudoxanthomonas sp. OG2]MBV7474789.1 hypothetical protein [Pseudoxanthomonas sp. PXM05]